MSRKSGETNVAFRAIGSNGRPSVCKDQPSFLLFENMRTRKQEEIQILPQRKGSTRARGHDAPNRIGLGR
jgi:hypothetical protein